MNFLSGFGQKYKNNCKFFKKIGQFVQDFAVLPYGRKDLRLSNRYRFTYTYFNAKQH